MRRRGQSFCTECLLQASVHDCCILTNSPPTSFYCPFVYLKPLQDHPAASFLRCVLRPTSTPWACIGFATGTRIICLASHALLYPRSHQHCSTTCLQTLRRWQQNMTNVSRAEHSPARSRCKSPLTVARRPLDPRKTRTARIMQVLVNVRLTSSRFFYVDYMSTELAARFE